MNSLNGTEVATVLVKSWDSLDKGKIEKADEKPSDTAEGPAKKIVYVTDDVHKKLKRLAAFGDCFMSEVLDQLVTEKYDAVVKALMPK